jgi:integrase
VAHQLSEWAIKIQHLGRRETFPLGTANRAAAAAKAKKIYLALKSGGWDTALTTFKQKREIRSESATTVGDFLEQVISTAGGRPKTIQGYCRAFRKIVADVFSIDGGVSKFDYRVGGGREKWVATVHAVELKDITPAKIQSWKIAFLSRAGADPVKRRAAQVSVNSLMRQAKSLFAAKVLKFVQLDISGTPFDGVEFEPRQSMRYRSGLDIRKLINEAQNELPTEKLKIFLLATMAGLRRNEIDKLEWAGFRWNEGVIRIEATRYFHPKSEDSLGDVEVDSEFLAVFRSFHALAKTTFVIESAIRPRPDAIYSHYRCERQFEKLSAWLRGKGITGNMPLHTLRKEFGSQICAKYGIYAASRALRHADIAITSQHYLDRRRRATVGLGGLLKAPVNVVAMQSDRVPVEVCLRKTKPAAFK